MRGISTIASLVIVGRTVSDGIDELFKIDCDYCNGTGKVVCTKCLGTKILARRPFQKVTNLQVFNRRQEDLFECFLCGSSTIYDNFGPLGEEEDFNETDRIKDSMKNVLRNNPMTKNKSLAGTILCSKCQGQRAMWHSTPNLPRLFGFEEIWFMKPLSKSLHAYCLLGWPKAVSRYTEWPGQLRIPIKEREVGYFGDDVFDYQDLISLQTWDMMEEDFERKRSLLSNEKAQKEPDDLEDFNFLMIQNL